MKKGMKDLTRIRLRIPLSFYWMQIGICISLNIIIKLQTTLAVQLHCNRVLCYLPDCSVYLNI